jgi:hypothetical protein
MKKRDGRKHTRHRSQGEYRTDRRWRWNLTLEGEEDGHARHSLDNRAKTRLTLAKGVKHDIS